MLEGVEIPTPEEAGVIETVSEEQVSEDASKIAAAIAQYLVGRIPVRDDGVIISNQQEEFPWHIKYDDVGVMDLPVFAVKPLAQAWGQVQIAFKQKGWRLCGHIVTPRCVGCYSRVVVTQFQPLLIK